MTQTSFNDKEFSRMLSVYVQSFGAKKIYNLRGWSVFMIPCWGLPEISIEKSKWFLLESLDQILIWSFGGYCLFKIHFNFVIFLGL